MTKPIRWQTCWLQWVVVQLGRWKSSWPWSFSIMLPNLKREKWERWGLVTERWIYIYIYYIVFKEGEWTKEKLFKCITGRICMEKRSHENGWAQKVLTRFSLLHWIALCTRMVQNSEMAALNNLGASITPHDFMALSTQQLVEPCKGHDS